MNVNPPQVRAGHAIRWIAAVPREDARELMVRLASMPWGALIVKGRRPARIGDKWAVVVRAVR